MHGAPRRWATESDEVPWVGLSTIKKREISRLARSSEPGTLSHYWVRIASSRATGCRRRSGPDASAACCAPALTG